MAKLNLYSIGTMNLSPNAKLLWLLLAIGCGGGNTFTCEWVWLRNACNLPYSQLNAARDELAELELLDWELLPINYSDDVLHVYRVYDGQYLQEAEKEEQAWEKKPVPGVM